jgi:hypothetical protein
MAGFLRQRTPILPRPTSRSSRGPPPALRWGLLAGAALLMLGGPVWLDLRPARPEGPARVTSLGVRSGSLLAGAGRAEVRLPPDVPLAGYRPFGRKATGAAEPTHVRALLLDVAGLRVALVLTELMTVPAPLAAAIRAQASAEGAGCAVVVATHTHSGPGGYDRGLLQQAVALGRYDGRVEEALLAASAAALSAAASDLGTAQLSSGESSVPDLVRNRDRAGAEVDGRLTVLALDRPDGTHVARIARLAAHPTLAGRHGGLSGDWPGRAMASWEEQGGVAFVLPGAEGDAAARVPAGEDDRAARFAHAAIERARAVPLAEIGPPVALGCAEAGFELPRPSAPTSVPRALRRLAGNALALVAPRSAGVTAVRLDDLALVFEPAEPTAASTVAAPPGLRARVVGLSQGYLGYAPDAPAFEAAVFSTRFAWFGPELASRLDGAAAAAVRALASPRE